MSTQEYKSLVFKKTKPPVWQPDATDYTAHADGFKFVITTCKEQNGHTSASLMVKTSDGSLSASRGIVHSLADAKAELVFLQHLHDLGARSAVVRRSRSLRSRVREDIEADQHEVTS